MMSRDGSSTSPRTLTDGERRKWLCVAGAAAALLQGRFSSD